MSTTNNNLAPKSTPARVTLAIVSDMHCRLSKDPTESSLEVGALRVPPAHHPVQALLDMIARDKVKADVLLVPGDLTNRACREGLSQAWDLALEIRNALGAKLSVPVLGNHDVDSRRAQPDREPFYNARNLRPGFPFSDANCVQSFFGEGFAIIDVNEAAEVIAINTVIDHHDEQTAKRGAFDFSRVSRLDSVLGSRPKKPIRLAMMHHHPVLHTGPFLQDQDVLSTGDALIEMLRQNDCRFVIHGHKHLARLTPHDGVYVFAAGSFTANLGIYSSSMANMFHLVEVEADCGWVRGTIETFVFHLAKGWGRANHEHSGFPFSAGFGRKEPVPSIAAKLIKMAQDNPSIARFSSQKLIEATEDLQFLTPTELLELRADLEAVDVRLVDSADGYLELWRTFNG